MKYKTALLSVRIEPELKEKAEQIAKEQGDTISRYLIKLIKEDIEKHEKP